MLDEVTVNSGEIKLFNLKNDYREEHNLVAAMPEKVAEMDAIRRSYVEQVDGGTAQQVREALYKTMDRFGNQVKDSFRKKMANLKKSNLPDLEAKTTALLNELNQKLKKNELNKEKARLHADLHSSQCDLPPTPSSDSQYSCSFAGPFRSEQLRYGEPAIGRPFTNRTPTKECPIG